MAGTVAAAAQHRVGQRQLLQQSIQQEGLDGRDRGQFLRAALLSPSQHHRRRLSILSSKLACRLYFQATIHVLIEKLQS